LITDVEKEHTPRLVTHSFTDSKKSLYKEYTLGTEENKITDHSSKK